MMFKSGNVTLMTANLPRAVRFYTETLGFALEYEVPGHWAQVSLPGLTVGLHPSGDEIALPGFSGDLSIGLEAKDFGAALESLGAKGVEFDFVGEGKATQTAYFRDPDGHALYVYCIRPDAGVPERYR